MKHYLILLFAYTFSVNLNAQNDEQNYELDSFVFISKRTISADKIQLSNKDFKKQAASFDDPSRLLMHYPGFSATGDQANAISYHGMPSALFSWQLNGLDIVNPNHLANAGTASDLGSSSAGGVNMMSGNIIDRYTFNTNHSVDKINGALGGVSDITLGAPERSYGQISLLGIEAGLKSGGSKLSIYGNFRYSFTGLLGDLGVKFGDEDIRFYDLVVGAKYIRKKSSWKIDMVNGGSKNIHLPVSNKDRPLDQQTIKDTLDIRYESGISIAAFQYQYQPNDQSRLSISLAASYRGDSRNMYGPVNLLNQNTYLALDVYRNDDARLSAMVDYKIKGFNLGIRSTIYDNEYVNSTSFFNTAPFTNNTIFSNFSEIIPYAKAERNLYKNLKAKAYLGAILGKEIMPTYNVNLTLPIGDLVLSASQGRSHQNLGSFYANKPDNPYVSSSNSLVEIKYIKSRFNTSIQAFHHGISNGPTFTGKGNVYQYFTGLDGLDYNKNLIYNSANQKYQVYGLTGQIEYHLPQFWINTNATLYDQDFVSESFYKYAFNINIGKDIQLKNNKLSLSTSMHYRGAQPFFAIDLDKHYVNKRYDSAPRDIVKDYSRIDLRAVYNLKNSLWSLDIQNVTSQINHTFITPTSSNEFVFGGGLGMIPVLTWKRMF